MASDAGDVYWTPADRREPFAKLYIDHLEEVNKALVEALSYMVAQFSASGETHSDEEALEEARAALKQAEEANRG